MTINLTTEQAHQLGTILSRSKHGVVVDPDIANSLIAIIDEALDQERMLEIERGE